MHAGVHVEMIARALAAASPGRTLVLANMAFLRARSSANCWLPSPVSGSTREFFFRRWFDSTSSWFSFSRRFCNPARRSAA